jgi:hypothetical protein
MKPCEKSLIFCDFSLEGKYYSKWSAYSSKGDLEEVC